MSYKGFKENKELQDAIKEMARRLTLTLTLTPTLTLSPTLTLTLTLLSLSLIMLDQHFTNKFEAGKQTHHSLLCAVCCVMCVVCVVCRVLCVVCCVLCVVCCVLDIVRPVLRDVCSSTLKPKAKIQRNYLNSTS